MKACKNEFCAIPDDWDAMLEASGYCFTCAEELACLLAEEGLDPSIAWKAD